MIKRKHIRVTTHYATNPRKIFIAAAAMVVVACGGTTPLETVTTNGGVAVDAGKPLDAGLSADARLEDCLADGIRMCGTKVGCFENGPNCDCRGVLNELKNPEVGWCFPQFKDDFEIRICQACADGDVCVMAYGLRFERVPVCGPENVGRMVWHHGQGSRVTYADATPYTGEPIPKPTTCPPPDGDLRYCGGNCGGCSAPGERCSGRSPTHPWGICVPENPRCDQCAPSEGCLDLTAIGINRGYVSRCIADCERIAANVPGGARCL